MKNANPVSRATGVAVSALLALCASGCGSGKGADAAHAFKTVSDHFEVEVGGHATQLQFAVNTPEQERGLMHRPDLGRDEGMLFVYAAPQRVNFWMSGTPESLDIAYLGRDGVIAEIYPLYPNDLRTVASRSDQIQFALEMPQGWYAANGVRAGAHLDLKALAAGLVARGLDPAAFGLR
jgi:uncharacterized protein